MKYDTLGRLALETDPAGGSTTLARTDADRSYTASLTTALNRTTTYQVESQTTGNERRLTTFPDGTQTELLVGTDGSYKVSSADATTVNLLEGPDPRFSMQAPLPASLTTTTGGLTTTLTIERKINLADPNNLLSLTSLTDTITLNGRASSSVYNSATKTLTQTSAAGRQAAATIDAQGRIIQAQLFGILPASLTYDAQGRLATITAGTGSDKRTATFSYGNDGNLQTVSDPSGQSSTLQYDAAGRIIQSTLPDGRGIAYTYDLNGNLTSLTPPGRSAHIFTYTSANLISQYSPPSLTGTGSTLFAYNADRQLTLVTRPDNKTVGLAYDCCRLSTVTLGRGVYTYRHDPTTGYLSGITAPDGGTLVYNLAGALLTNTTWSGTVTGAVGVTYDNDLRVTSLSVNGASVTFGYDDDSLLTQAGNLSLLRDPQGGLVTRIALGNVIDDLSYNGFAELTSSSVSYNTTPLVAEQYTRDQLGRITRRVETIDGVTTTFDYGYDPAERLFEVKQNGTTTASYGYDSNGNRASVTRAAVITNGAYDDQDRLTQYGDITYNYTANGELQTKTVGNQTTTYIYDEVGNLMSVTLPSGTSIEYVIDGQNSRIGKKINGKLTQGFLYQDRIKPIAELDGDNHLVSRFVYATGINVPDYMVKNGTTYRIVTDQLGSPRLVIDVATGTIAQRMDYDEFGVVLTDTNPGFQPFGFAGGLYDRDSQLVRFGIRDYDPTNGRWTTKDPIAFAAGDTNLYAYVGSDPIDAIDPLGKDDLCQTTRNSLEEAKSMRNAFANPTLLEQARKKHWDGKEYNEAVKQQVFGPGATEGHEYEKPMGVNANKNCNIEEKWTREVYRNKGLGDVGYEADRVHEAVHSAHCKAVGHEVFAAVQSFPAKLSKEETEAYDAKIHYLEDWISKNCH